MSVRINKAKNFKGKAYVAADELDNLVKSMTFANAGDAITGTNAADTWKINFTNLDGTPDTTSAVDLTAIKNYIDNRAITVSGGNGISIDTITNPLNPTISADIDSATIVFDGNTDGSKVLKAGLTIVKLDTATTGYAASYQLQDASGKAVGSTIDIVKDQFLKNVVLGYGTFVDADTAPTGWTTTKDGTKQAILKLTFNTNTNGDDTAEDTKDVYILVDEMFHDKTAGNYVDATALGSNVIKVNVGNGIDASNSAAITVLADSASEKVWTAKGTSAVVLSVGADGVKVANIQAAIDNAVTAEHNTASAAIEDLEGDVLSFESATSAAVDDLNTRIGAVASNAEAAVKVVSAAVSAVDSKVDASIAAVDANVSAVVSAAIDSANAAIGSSVSAINTEVTSVVGELNTRVEAVASNAQSAANALETEINALDSKVDGAFAALDTAIETAIDAVQTSVTNHTANAVQMVESDVTPVLKDGTSAVYETTVTCNHVVAVYGASNGDQIYPDIVKGNGGVFTLTADYGTAQSTVEGWTVLCTKPLASYTAVDVTDTDYSVTATAAKTVANGTAAGYEAPTAETAAQPTYAAAGYDTTTIGTVTVAGGTAATAPAANAAVAKDAPSYKENA